MKVNEDHSLDLLALYRYTATKDMHWEIGKYTPFCRCVRKDDELEEEGWRVPSVSIASGAIPLGILKGFVFNTYANPYIHCALVPVCFSLGSWCHHVTSQEEKNKYDADFAE